MNKSELRARWNGLAPREKTLVLGAAALVAFALLWWLALAPALATLRSAESQHRTLDAQLQQMQRLQAQAQAMQAQPRQTYDEALRQLEQAIRGQLGTTARYSIAAERVTVTLTGASGQVLGQWLAQVRVNARALPGEARLVRNANGSWDGTLVLTLPPR
ncbi:type II secretion system protein M [Caenimonas sedimenti]|uniref:Type II secretion system protein M n=1 Tax=Caenimonas sedimenti TaxID=2596921 RepID=A0A562ZEQ8_9BURK|nr:type II secretion system protein GspM [Caenimonas sedimenti]TWO65528.1 type II secretion system protein M [Caenimonas sedimenti]